MVEKFIADVPSNIWAENRPASRNTWESSFNVASWVRVSGAQGKFALYVVHEDGAGTHRTLIDEAVSTGEGSSLLSSQVRLLFTKKVTNVRITLELEDPAMRHQVEELYMQLKDSQQQSRKLIANY